METIMSKTNDAANLDHGALTDTELDEVSGGLVVIPIIGISVGLLLPAVNFCSRGLTNWIRCGSTEKDHEH
jgi:hypothetical protein